MFPLFDTFSAELLTPGDPPALGLSTPPLLHYLEHGLSTINSRVLFPIMEDNMMKNVIDNYYQGSIDTNPLIIPAGHELCNNPNQ